MANLLPIPDDLQQLIEKREEPDRRTVEDRRTAAGSDADIPPAPGGDTPPATPDRRSDTERRQAPRRETDGEQ